MADHGLVKSSGDGLGDEQQVAFAALRAGRSFAQAAEEADVNRTTIYRWVHGDPRFRAAYNAWKREMAESAHVRMLKLADKAVDVVERALDKDDAKVAVRMLKHLAVMRRPKSGRTDAEGLKLQMDQRERARDLGDLRMMTKHLLDKAGLSSADQRRYLRKHGYMAVAKQVAEMSRSKAAAERIEPGQPQVETSTAQAATDMHLQPAQEPERESGNGPARRVEAMGPWFEEIEHATENATEHATPPAMLHDVEEDAEPQVTQQQDVA
jgi:hypothetical protein